MAQQAGIITIHGREYQTVAYRVSTFRGDHPDWTITTKVVTADETTVVIKATIKDGDRIIATGHAEETRGSSNINLTSALENAETSAVGRALAFYGLAGVEIASAEEEANALIQQKEKEVISRYVAHADAFKRHWESIVGIKEYLAANNLSAAWEAYQEIPDDDKTALRVAPTKGAIWTLDEAKKMKQAAEDDFDPEAGVYRSIADKESK